MTTHTLQLIEAAEHAADEAGVLALTNDADPRAVSLDGVSRIDLVFPKFADGRAFSQAFLLRRRLGFKGDIRATGEVLVDQLVQMQRTGFSSAVLRAGEDAGHARKLFAQYSAYYQGDAVNTQPLFRKAA
ncbi:DUF934 domain-containing protein [Caenimonas koreensis]|uniref:DUF934 domain-containing protein n=1 Tax=Caenimonas koreensis DSM 17982 TaxID=1121255 RepID=A0A844B588_9BURK|nr:DUF934 domain-containing protein [Caenimonas koreensis]MRD45721.1 DUF934 domain-containing protein [Caenimonas koreensis DSM 17982]